MCNYLRAQLLIQDHWLILIGIAAILAFMGRKVHTCYINLVSKLSNNRLGRLDGTDGTNAALKKSIKVSTTP